MKEYAVIWDMDGVLLNSHEMIWTSINQVLGNYGVHLNGDDIKRYIGMSLHDDIQDWNRRYRLNLELTPFSNQIWKIQSEFLRRMKPDEGLVCLLDDLKSQNIKMAVGTSSQRFRADLILDSLNLKKYFQAIASANDVSNHKPHPDIFLEAAKRLGVMPEMCAVIEDAANGIEAAKRGRMRTIGYVNGCNDAEDLLRADLIVRGFSELSYEKIRRLFG